MLSRFDKNQVEKHSLYRNSQLCQTDSVFEIMRNRMKPPECKLSMHFILLLLPARSYWYMPRPPKKYASKFAEHWAARTLHQAALPGKIHGSAPPSTVDQPCGSWCGDVWRISEWLLLYPAVADQSSLGTSSNRNAIFFRASLWLVPQTAVCSE